MASLSFQLPRSSDQNFMSSCSLWLSIRERQFRTRCKKSLQVPRRPAAAPRHALSQHLDHSPSSDFDGRVTVCVVRAPPCFLHACAVQLQVVARVAPDVLARRRVSTGHTLPSRIPASLPDAADVDPEIFISPEQYADSNSPPRSTTTEGQPHVNKTLDHVRGYTILDHAFHVVHRSSTHAHRHQTAEGFSCPRS